MDHSDEESATRKSAQPAETISAPAPPAPAKKSFFRPFYVLLRDNRLYRYLWLAHMISTLGDYMSFVANMTNVSNLADGSSLASAVYMVVRRLPPFIFGPIVGVLADSYDRRTLLIISDAARAVLLFLLTLGSQFYDRLWVIYVIVFLQFSFSALFDPSRLAIIPEVVGLRDVATASVLDSVTRYSLLFVGSALGGFLVSRFGVSVVYACDGVTFILSMVSLTRLWAPEWEHRNIHSGVARGAAPVDGMEVEGLIGAGEESGAGGEKELEQEMNIVGDVKESEEIASGEAAKTHENGCSKFVASLRYLWRNPFVLGVSLFKTGVQIDCVNVLATVVFCEQIFRIKGDPDGSLTMGIVWALVGFGTATAPFLARPFTQNTIESHFRTIMIGLLTVCVFTFGQVWDPNAVWYNIMNTVAQGGWAVVMVFSTSLLQLVTEHEYRGRVMAFEGGMWTITYSILALSFGSIIDQYKMTAYMMEFIVGVTYVFVIFMMIVFYVYCKRKGYIARHAAELSMHQ